MTNTNPLKRSALKEDSSFPQYDVFGMPATKRLKTSPDVLILGPHQLPTPPADPAQPSTAETTPSTKPITLSLEIPPRRSEDVSKATLVARKGAATRWKKNLQNPFPTAKETKKAYNMKLLRHYPSPNDKTLASIPYVKPRIEQSSRVKGLLKRFPKLDIPAPNSVTRVTHFEVMQNRAILNTNRIATQTDSSVKSAWKNFAHSTRTTRGLMRESGLATEDLYKEYVGIENKLPEWKKWRTHPLWGTDDDMEEVEEVTGNDEAGVRGRIRPTEHCLR